MTKCYVKTCKSYWSRDTKKDCIRKLRQSYKCKFYNSVWISKSRSKHENLHKSYNKVDAIMFKALFYYFVA